MGMTTKAPRNVKAIFTDLTGTTLKIKAEWTRAEDYKDQMLICSVTYPKGTKKSITKHDINIVVPVGNSVNTKTFSVDLSDHCKWQWDNRKPSFEKITINIRGRAKTKQKQGTQEVVVWKPWSDVGSKVIKLEAPDLSTDPSVKHDNETHVTFTFAKKTNNHAPIYGYDYYLDYIEDYPGSGRPKWSARWSPQHCGGDDTSLGKSIGTYPGLGHHKTVFLAIRAYGPGGIGPWHYAHHVFGQPDLPTSWTFTASKTSSNALNLAYSFNYPTRTYGSVFTKAKYEYCIATPTFSISQSGQTAIYAISEPPGLNYTTAIESNKAETTSITASVQTDQVIYGRIELINNDDLHPQITSGLPVASGSHSSGAIYGDLSMPTFTSITYNDNTKTVTIDGVSTTSSVAESYTVVIAKSKNGKSAIIGRLDHSETTKSCKVPDTVLDGSSLSFGIQSLVANYTPITPSQTAPTVYSISNRLMQSNINWKDGAVPGKPTLTLTNASNSMEGARILVGWGAWPIGMAKLVLEYTSASDGWYDKSSINSVEISISDSANTQTIISGLDYASDSFSGIYYFRARYITEGTEVYGHYSDVKQITLHATAPPKPELRIDPTRVPVDMPFNLYWAYISGDKSTQKACDVYEAFIENNNITYSAHPIASANTEQRLSLIPQDSPMNWTSNTTHYLAIKTMSSYGTWSEMSEYREINVARAITLDVTLGTGFSEVVDPETQESHIELTQFPFTISVSDAAGTAVSIVISETGSMVKSLPNDTDEYIFDGDVIYSSLIAIDEVTGAGSITVNKDGFFNNLMHNRTYHLKVFNEDGYGQYHSYETDFVVNWDHTATIPSATIVIDNTTDSVSITPTVLSEEGVDISDTAVEEGDYCDIYRQSIDGWTRICTLGDFNETYIDQHPTLGSFGGYRVVFVSKYGDDSDEIGNYAWYTYEYSEEDKVGVFQTIIDFGDYSVNLPYDLTFSRSWSKDFIETKYLGGSIQGDWNSAVSHSISMNTTVAIEYDTDLYRDMHKLATYAGVCRVRTPDGTNIWANVDVKEDKEAKWVNRIAKFSLDITKIDNDENSEVTLVE